MDFRPRSSHDCRPKHLGFRWSLDDVRRLNHCVSSSRSGIICADATFSCSFRHGIFILLPLSFVGLADTDATSSFSFQVSPRLTSLIISPLGFPIITRTFLLVHRHSDILSFMSHLRLYRLFVDRERPSSWEATVHLRDALGEHYNFCNENVFVSLWKNFRSCQVSSSLSLPFVCVHI